jgi:hypothetical protein
MISYIFFDIKKYDIGYIIYDKLYDIIYDNYLCVILVYDALFRVQLNIYNLCLEIYVIYVYKYTSKKLF